MPNALQLPVSTIWRQRSSGSRSWWAIAALIFGLAPVEMLWASPTSAPISVAANCLARQDINTAFQLAASIPMSAREASMWQALYRKRGRCKLPIPAEASTAQIDAMAGAIAELLYRSMISKGVGGNLDDPARAAQLNLAGKDDWPPVARALDCVVVQNLGAADRMMRSTPGSTMESQFIGVLVSTLPICVPADEKLSIGRATFRTAVARALFRQLGVPVIGALDRIRP
ncbi:MAG: hypothetical protein ACOYLS_07230 [Polymorphobacter sp.]